MRSAVSPAPLGAVDALPAAAPVALHGARVPWLDVLRGVAVLGVIVHHLPDPTPSTPPLVVALFGPLHFAGWAGVDMFFVLSGYLVSGLLFRETQRRGTADLGRFLVRRAFKIYPAYFYFVALTVTAQVVAGSLSLAQSWPLLLFVQNYVPMPPGWGHTWSLAVEEHFYILLALAVGVALRRRSADPFAWLPLAIAGLLVATIALRLQAAGLPVGASSRQTHLRLDQLAIGVLLSYHVHFTPAALERWRARWLPTPTVHMLATVALLSPLAFWDADAVVMKTIGHTVVGFGFAALLFFVLRRPPELGPLGRAMAAIGVWSYSIYLWQLVPKRLLLANPERYLGWELPWTARAVLIVAGALALGIGMGRLVERRALALRERLFPSRSE